jgi:mono/diheme cytochrome c family protein
VTGILSTRRIAGATLLLLLAGGAQAKGAADPKEGLKVARNVCSACHVVGKKQPTPPILRPPAPSFASIANRPNIAAETIRSFVQTTHSTVGQPDNMPNPELTEDQVADVAAYVMSLRKAR